MKRRLFEAKADLDLAVVKAIARKPLTVSEVHELNDMSVRDLMAEHDLDYVLAERVSKHTQHEMLRLQAQDQFTPMEDANFGFTSLTRSNPITQKPLKLSESSLRKLVRKMVDEENSG